MRLPHCKPSSLNLLYSLLCKHPRRFRGYKKVFDKMVFGRKKKKLEKQIAELELHARVLEEERQRKEEEQRRRDEEQRRKDEEQRREEEEQWRKEEEHRLKEEARRWKEQQQILIQKEALRREELKRQLRKEVQIQEEESRLLKKQLENERQESERKENERRSKIIQGQQRRELERIQKRERAQRRLERLKLTSPEGLRGLRDLIRTRYQLDMYIWSLKDARTPDRPIVIENMEKADAVLSEIVAMVDSWEENDKVWTPKEWEIAQEIKKRIHAGGKRWWVGNPPWDEH
ncbi:hypothetical protein GP486_005226 [Trichoglossum hirsutum]|uniref:Uncharacterized protein n=1 Tax=Trichoglossum hirsutum TaxID=265104 RepID=A0A9P8RML9_9PEZI|nr:hypothetical protein GP486_005226 [Trichoglossum hirsutum]